MYTRERIIDILQQHKAALIRKYPISELGLFGSFARGDYREDSDIDILVDFNDRIDGFDYIRLAHEFEDIFQHKIDMVSRRGIKAGYLPYVERTLIHV
ncbi:nucleotidyltransferase family protein [Hufsiella ginkgonis]|uniref:DNA polymerase subunit beta n=1 Tax=Hufsiella ginkgonis TaxID=2695274 RepID=A0A7K1XZU9_9SPHI|nr:nucleotidyltransferase family protein [Hufsiella ginkgonis]MXV16544.1 DNA polymerase subunit beta [Hufsiella ginkgonis]